MDAMIQSVRIRIDWMTDRNIPEVMQVEEQSFEYCWTKEDFLNCKRLRKHRREVVRYNGKIVGFMVYDTDISVLNFAVAPRFRRLGIGGQMVSRLIRKLSNSRRTKITLPLRERNLVAQLFFRAQGFRAVRVLRGFYEDSGEDAFLMEYNIIDDVKKDCT